MPPYFFLVCYMGKETNFARLRWKERDNCMERCGEVCQDCLAKELLHGAICKNV